MALEWPAKDPDEVLDYQLNWAARLGTDTISSSSWEVTAGITKNSDTNTNKATTIWLSGGALDAQYDITNQIVTAGGRTMSQTVKLKVRAK